MLALDELLDALDRVGERPGKAVSAHLDPALNEAAKAAVAMGLAVSVSGLTGAALLSELRRLALRAVLDEHYAQAPTDRPDPVEVADFLAVARKLDIARRQDWADALRAMHVALGEPADPELLLAATAAHLAVVGSAA